MPDQADGGGARAHVHAVDRLENAGVSAARSPLVETCGETIGGSARSGGTGLDLVWMEAAAARERATMVSPERESWTGSPSR
ncbi:MAG: hypothetical protein U1E62_10850 [Alsobacter sp.]